MADLLTPFTTRYAQAITNSLTNSLPTQDWYSWAYRQRQRYPDQPVYIPGLELTQHPLSALAQVTNGDYEYVGVRLIKGAFSNEYLYAQISQYLTDSVMMNSNLMLSNRLPDSINTSSRQLVMWEFMGTPDGDYRPYLYVPANESYYQYLADKVPAYRWWGRTEYGTTFPYRDYIAPISIDKWGEYYELISTDIPHPYYKGLYFTGYVTTQGDGQIIYEYVDARGYIGPIGTRYSSDIRPNGIDFPLGIPSEGQLIKDDCLPYTFPEYGYEAWAGKYVGYKTTSRYHPTQTFYLYERDDASVFLYEAPSSLLGEVGAYKAIGDVGIVIEVGEVIERWEVFQGSCGVSHILLEDGPLPACYDYVYYDDYMNSCTMWDSSYRLADRANLIYMSDMVQFNNQLMLRDYVDLCSTSRV